MLGDKLVYLNETKRRLRVNINTVLAERGEPLLTSESTLIEYAASLFTPATLFSNGKSGLWWDYSDLSTLFQDVAGTIPVTADGDPVGLVLDKSGNGNHKTQSVSTKRLTYHTDGSLHWLTYDGVDDDMLFSIANRTVDMHVSVGARSPNSDASFALIASATTNYRVMLSLGTNQYIFYSGDTSADYEFLVDGVLVSSPLNRVGSAAVGNAISNKSAVLEVRKAPLNVAGFDSMATGSMGSDYYYDGDMFGVVIADSLTQQDESALRAYMANKSGVTL